MMQELPVICCFESVLPFRLTAVGYNWPYLSTPTYSFAALFTAITLPKIIIASGTSRHGDTERRLRRHELTNDTNCCDAALKLHTPSTLPIVMFYMASLCNLSAGLQRLANSLHPDFSWCFVKPGRNRNNFKFLTTAVHLSYSRTADWQLRAQCDYFGYQRTRCQSKYKIYTSGTHQLTTYGSSWLGRFHLKSWPFVALIEEFPLLQRRSHRMGCLLCLVFHLHYRCNANDANGS